MIFRNICLGIYTTVSILALSCNNESPKALNKVKNDSLPAQVKLIDSLSSDGLYHEYYPNKKAKCTGKLIDGKREGEWLFWYANGQLWSMGEFKNGMREGKSVVYYENGTLRMEGNYHDNKPTGQWKFYNEQGKVIKDTILKGQ